MSDLIERLRTPCSWCDCCKDCERLMDEAAVEIERLKEELRRLSALVADTQKDCNQARENAFRMGVEHARMKAAIQQSVDMLSHVIE